LAISAALRAHIGEVLEMAAIVNTLMYLPVGALLAAAFFLAGVSFEAFLTFDGALNAVQGLFAWWALGFMPACAYAAFVLPWSRTKS